MSQDGSSGWTPGSYKFKISLKYTSASIADVGSSISLSVTVNEAPFNTHQPTVS